MRTPETIDLVSGSSRASIALMGAEWRSWQVDGMDLLWVRNPAIWDAVAPILFPVCGWTHDGRVRLGDRTYPLGLHGFAARMMFDVAARGQDFVRLVLRDSEETRALYPFAFELSIDYRLGDGRMAVTAEARNRGDGPMPYAIGLHPGFRWPFAEGVAEDYSVTFDREERPEVPLIAPGGLFSARSRSVPLIDGRRLDLSGDLFAREALCFLYAASWGLRFAAPYGPRLRVDVDDFPHFALWSRPGAPFLCIETWTGHGDPEDFTGDLFEKPSMNTLRERGDARRHAALFSLERP